jgi:hypothetical protein
MCRVTVGMAARLDDRNRRQRVVGDIRVQIHRILDMRRDLLCRRHDGRVVLEWDADIAILVRRRALEVISAAAMRSQLCSRILTRPASRSAIPAA